MSELPRFGNGAIDLSQLRSAVQQDYQEKKVEAANETFGHSMVDLLPTEVAKVKEALVAAQRSLEKKASAELLDEKGLASWAEETDNRLRAIGFVAFVDPYNVEIDDDEQYYISPTIALTGRIEDKEFDYDKAKFQHQHGYAGGGAFKITESGEKKSI